MFDFFRRKQRPSEPVAEPVVQPEPIEPETGEPEAPAGKGPATGTPARDAETPAESPAREAEPAARPPEAVWEREGLAGTEEPPQANRRSWRERLRDGLRLTRGKLARQVRSLFAGRKLDEQTLEELESVLLMADVGPQATEHLLDDLKRRWKAAGSEGDVQEMLKASLLDLLAPLERRFAIGAARPFVIMLAGVNGAGKTTSIGKLARRFQEQGLSVLLAAGDTFRAAAREQLQVWGERNRVVVVAQEGGDPAAVMFDAIAAAKARGIDVVLADTAGRLPTQLHLMDEIRKAKRVIGKADPTAPHEVLLVLDANTGQNALAQVQAFDDALGLTGLILTKLDGSAKGGVVAAIAKNRPIPLAFIGVGEGIDDLRPFVAAEFVDALFVDEGTAPATAAT
jgi:fused signal recognition particle receptor